MPRVNMKAGHCDICKYYDKSFDLCSIGYHIDIRSGQKAFSLHCEKEQSPKAMITVEFPFPASTASAAKLGHWT